VYAYISSIGDNTEIFLIKNDGENVIVLSEVGSDGEFKILKYYVELTEIHKTLPQNNKPYAEVTSNEWDGITKVEIKKLYDNGVIEEWLDKNCNPQKFDIGDFEGWKCGFKKISISYNSSNSSAPVIFKYNNKKGDFDLISDVDDDFGKCEKIFLTLGENANYIKSEVLGMYVPETEKSLRKIGEKLNEYPKM
jgi:hypothetical protein